VGVVPVRAPLGPVHREEDKVMVQVRFINLPFLKDDTFTAVGALTAQNYERRLG